MTVTLELKPEEISVLADRAQAQGTDIESVLHGLVAQITPTPPQIEPQVNEKKRAAIALLGSWLAEKDEMTPEELAQNDVDFQEFKANINRWRAEEGRPAAFP